MHKFNKISQLFLIDTIESAKKLINDEKNYINEYCIITFHSIVVDYLLNFNIKSYDLSNFIDNHNYRDNYFKAEKKALQTLVFLDNYYSNDFSSELELKTKINWFYSLYRIDAVYDLFGVFNFFYCIKQVFEVYSPDKIIIYNNNSNSNIVPDGDLEFMLKSFSNFHKLNFSIEIRDSSKKTTHSNFSFKKTVFSLFNFRHEIYNLFTLKARNPIFLFDPLYDLKFLKNNKKIGNYIYWRFNQDPLVLGRLNIVSKNILNNFLGKIKNLEIKKFFINHKSIDDLAIYILANRLENNFLVNVSKYSTTLLKVNQYLLSNKLRMAIWGNDPSVGSKAIVIEYLMKLNFPILGYQHGASYGIQVTEEHYHSAYNFCTKFFSYGFTIVDLIKNNTLKQKQIKAKIIPVGSQRIKKYYEKSTIKRNKIKLFYPITNNYGIMFSSKRMKPDEFVNLQKKLLIFLNGFLNHCTIKLPPYSKDAPSCHSVSLSKYQNLGVTSKRVLDFVMENHIFAVLIDSNISTCLYELIPYDCEIFVIHDPMIQFNDDALNLLKKRVHYLYSFEEFESSYLDFINGKLSSLRNQEFQKKNIFNSEFDIEKAVLDAVYNN
jgi:hypothetical protein